MKEAFIFKEKFLLEHIKVFKDSTITRAGT